MNAHLKAESLDQSQVEALKQMLCFPFLNGELSGTRFLLSDFQMLGYQDRVF